MLELLESFPGDPLQIGTVLGGEGPLERPALMVLSWLAVLGAVVVHGVDGQTLGTAVEQGGMNRACGKISPRLVPMVWVPNRQ